ncbi:MAG: hypothetical protein HC923_07015 [Myxococcales bacterium]|nr:hypothetical protein [Myxococcales bacterium]
MSRLWLVLGLFVSSSALAAPIYEANAPSATVELVEDEGRLELTVSPGFDPNEVAALIAKALPKAQIVVDGSRVLLDGVDVASTKRKLATLEVERNFDDVDALLAQMRDPGADEQGSGTSVRARREESLAVSEGTKSAPLVARVTKIERQTFPLVFLDVAVQEIEGSFGKLTRGSSVIILPRVRSRKGVVDPSDETSRQNMGAWYVKPGDLVKLVLEPRPEGQAVWIAASVERLP